MERRDKINYYLDLAEMVSQRSTCLRRRYGAVIVNNDEVVSTGYNGAPLGRKNCTEVGWCIREKLKISPAWMRRPESMWPIPAAAPCASAR